MNTRRSLAVVTLAALIAAAGTVIAQNQIGDGTLPQVSGYAAVPANKAQAPATTNHTQNTDWQNSTQATAAPAQPQSSSGVECPTPFHENMRALAGIWEGEVALFTEPGAEPVTSRITVVNSFSFGRYLTTSFATSVAGQPFQGVQTMGFNTAKNQYESTSIDNLSTAITFNTGSCDDSGTTFTLNGSFDDPSTGETHTQKTVTHVDGTRYTIECFDVASDGSETPLMKISLNKASGQAVKAASTQNFKQNILSGRLSANKPVNVDRPMKPGTTQTASAQKPGPSTLSANSAEQVEEAAIEASASQQAEDEMQAKGEMPQDEAPIEVTSGGETTEPGTEPQADANPGNNSPE